MLIGDSRQRMCQNDVAPNPVAPTGSRLYRRLATGGLPPPAPYTRRLPIGDTAGYQPALRNLWTPSPILDWTACATRCVRPGCRLIRRIPYAAAFIAAATCRT